MTLTYAERDKVYVHLRELKENFRPKSDRRARAIMLIGACITHGFDTRGWIIKGLRATGLSVDHVVGLLDEQTGNAPGLSLWRLDDDGRYHLLDPA